MRLGGRVEVVVEYWCYYVYNAFTVRGGWLPYRVRDNHPHDLERVYLVLTPTDTPTTTADPAEPEDEAWARRTFQIRSVIANAHDGSIPPNQFDAREDEAISPPLTLLVERGSHAMAPDINQDGRFTPGVDSTATPKIRVPSRVPPCIRVRSTTTSTGTRKMRRTVRAFGRFTRRRLRS